MSNSTGPENSTPRADAQTSMFDASENFEPSRVNKARSSAPASMKGTRSLARLRDRVHLAVKELDRLKAENQQLRKELERVSTESQQPIEGTSVIFAEPAEDLRSRIELCIQAIDSHLNSQDSTSVGKTGA